MSGPAAVDIDLGIVPLEASDDGFLRGRQLELQRAILVLSVDRGGLYGLGHPMFGNRIMDLIGSTSRNPPDQVLVGLVEEALEHCSVRYERVLGQCNENGALSFKIMMASGSRPNDSLLLEI